MAPWDLTAPNRIRRDLGPRRNRMGGTMGVAVRFPFPPRASDPCAHRFPTVYAGVSLPVMDVGADPCLDGHW